MTANPGLPHRNSTLSLQSLALIFLTCLGASAVLFSDCIGLGRSIFGRDTVAHDYGMLLWAWRRVLAAGRLPLWNPYLFGGIPTVGSFAFCPFVPSAICFALAPFPLAFTLQYLLAFAVGGTGMALLARRQGLGTAAALAAGLVFALSGHLTTLAHAGHLTKALAFCWVPWIFAAAETWHERKRWSGAAAMSVPLCLTLTASHFQIAYLAALSLAGWTLWRAAAEGLWRKPRLALLTAVQLGSAIALAAALGAIQVLPGLEMTPLSNRAEGIAADEAARTSYPPAELLEYFAPGWIGADAPGARGPYLGSWGAPKSERIVSDYFGVLALALAIVALARSKRLSKRLWAAMALAGIWIALGEATPLLHWLRAGLPGFDRFRSPAVALGWATLGGVVLAAMGLECVLTRPSTGPKNPARAAGVWALGGVCLAAASTTLRMLAPRPDVAEQLDRAILGHFLLLESLAYALLVLAVGAALGAAGAWISAAPPPKAQTARRFLTVAWIAALAFDAGWRSRDYVAPFDHAHFERYLESAAPSKVQADPEPPVRILQRGQELTNAFMGSGVGSIHGYHPIVYERYDRLIRFVGFFSPAASALFHQNWLLWTPGEESPAPWRPVELTPRGTLCERLPRTPYVFFPRSCALVSDEGEAWKQMARGDFSPESLAIVEGLEEFGPNPAAPEASVRVAGYSPNEVEFEADLSAQGLAVFADLMAPGWTLRRLDAEGRPSQAVPTFYANLALRGAVLPAGSARYVWRYEPFSFRLGAFVSLLAWSGLAAFAFARRARKQTEGARPG